MNWPEVERVFYAALEIPAGERRDWLNRTAAGNDELVSEVMTLLESHEACEIAVSPPRIGPYRLERLLGRGGMGEVWLASRADGSFEQQVAVKLVRPGFGAEILLPRFHRERELLARLNHPNIALLLDGGVSPDGRPYLVTQYIQGEPLLEYCERRRLDVRGRLELFRKLCSAVEYAHRNLIVHRDLKPGNVLVTADGTPKLLDFGLAKILGEDTSATVPILTPAYASPEQLRGEAVATVADVYSLGVVLFELLTGSLPYTARTTSATETIDAITRQEPRRASQIEREGIRPVPPGDLDAILAKALEKSPERRYSSVESLSADIANFLEDRPVTARRPTRAYYLAKYLRRHWRGAAAGALAVTLLAGATAFSIHSAQVANRQRARAERIAGFLEDIFGAADPAVRRSGLETGASVTLLELMRAASLKLRTVFAEDPVVAGEIRLPLARTYIHLGLFDEAQQEIQATLAHFDAMASDPVAQARTLEIAGMLDYRRHRFDDAERRMRAALRLSETSGEAARQPNVYAIDLNNLAMVLSARGKPAEAEKVLRRAESLMRNPSPGDLGVVENNLGLMDFNHANLGQAQSELNRALDLFRRIPNPPLQLAGTELNLGLVQRFQGHYPEALALFQQAAASALQIGGPKNPDLLATQIEAAYQRGLNGDIAGAAADLRNLYKQTETPQGSGEHNRALVTFGDVLTLAGDPRSAEPMLREVLANRLKHPPRDYRVAEAEFVLGKCLQRQERPEEAHQLFADALQDFRNTLGPRAWIGAQAAAAVAATSK